MRLKRKCFWANTQPRDPSGGPVEVEKVIRFEMDDIGTKQMLASTQPGDHFGGPAEVKKVIRVETD